MSIIILSVLAYFVGAIPSGYWYAKYVHGVDVTAHGSGNIGATNVGRVLGSKKHFALIFFADFLKATLFLFGTFFALTAWSGMSTDLVIRMTYLLSCLLLVGNSYSIFLKFYGGKGVSTALGILALLFPNLLLLFMFVWLLCFIRWRRVDIASLIGLLAILLADRLVLSPFSGLHEQTLLLYFIVIWVLVRHKNNIRNLFYLRGGS